MPCCPVNLILEGGGQLITCDVICSEFSSPEICFFCVLSIEMERHDKLGDNDMEVFCLSEAIEACTLRTVRSAITAYYLRCQRTRNDREKGFGII